MRALILALALGRRTHAGFGRSIETQFTMTLVLHAPISRKFHPHELRGDWVVQRTANVSELGKLQEAHAR